MQFNSETNGLDLYSDARYLCGLETGDGGGTPDTTSYPIKSFTRNANLALDKITGWKTKSDGMWPSDDTNQTGELLDLTTNVVAGTAKYAIGATWLKIKRLRIKDSSGNWITIPNVDRKAIGDTTLTEGNGTPRCYFLLGNYAYLVPGPSYSSSGGMEVQYQRGASYFVYTDTTKTPGFDVNYHRLVSMMCALEFCKVNTLTDRVSQLMVDIGTPPDLLNNQSGSGMAKEFIDSFASRDADAKISFQPLRTDYGELSLNPGSGSFPNGSQVPKGF